MPRKLFRRIMPPREQVQQHRFLRHLGDVLHEPNLWYLNRHSAATAVFIGLFCAFQPIPFQMVLSAFMAIGLRGNLPVAIALVWISNPLTMPPMLYGAYRLGTLVLGMTPQSFTLHLSLAHWRAELDMIWQPLLLGGLLSGLIIGTLGYAMVKIVWRIMIVRQWRQRKARRRQPAAHLS